MAKTMKSDQAPNLTPEDFLTHYRRVAEAKRELEKIEQEVRSVRGQYRSALKQAKRGGVNQAMLVEALRIRTTADEAEVAMDLRDLGRYLRYLNAPLGEQFLLFDDQASEVPPSAAEQQAAWDADDTGYRQAQAGVSADENPWPQGSQLAQAWSVGHARGAKVLADFEAGKPAAPPAKGRRRASGNPEDRPAA